MGKIELLKILPLKKEEKAVITEQKVKDAWVAAVEEDKKEVVELKQPEKPKEPQQENIIYQAIGVIVGDVNFGEKNTVTIKGKEYPLFYNIYRKKAFEALQKHVENNGKQQRLVVYPRVIHFPQRDKDYQVSFVLVGFANGENRGGVLTELEDFQFRLSGLWQFIPCCKYPCITVHRNFNEKAKDYLKNPDNPAHIKARIVKSLHIPVMWNSDERAFRFNPKLEKEKRGFAKFCSIKVKFNVDRNIFQFNEEIIKPQKKSPKHLFLHKDIKADVMKSKLKAIKEKKAIAQAKNK